MKPGKHVVEILAALPDQKAERIVGEMDGGNLKRLLGEWPAWVHEGQEAPERADWRVWVMLAGRGFGKTRAGAEWISRMAREHPGASIALVAANAAEARKVMIEGPSGLLAVARPGERPTMRWEPSLKRLTFASGAAAFLYSGANADGLRGPQHHFAWCDELAKWRQAEAAWDNLMLGLRLGENPRALVTTTPRPTGVLKAIIADRATARTGGSTFGNPHLAPGFGADMERRYGGTRLGRQEIDGELIEDLEGALWSRALIEASREERDNVAHDCARVAVGVDPPASSGVCGIVVCGVDRDGTGHVLADWSGGGLSPDGWARKVAAAAAAFGAARVVAEANNGGKMVESVLRGAAVGLPVRLVHAAEGKAARAAPVAALFECGRAKLAGRFPELEDELAGLTWDGDYRGPGRSPDRADAMVWAMTELMLGPPRAEPRIRSL
jgi:phage terminase large subunit-like protein